jgi:hypothetical protein
VHYRAGTATGAPTTGAIAENMMDNPQFKSSY